jgi:hypothetical protein
MTLRLLEEEQQTAAWRDSRFASAAAGGTGRESEGRLACNLVKQFSYCAMDEINQSDL